MYLQGSKGENRENGGLVRTGRGREGGTNGESSMETHKYYHMPNGEPVGICCDSGGSNRNVIAGRGRWSEDAGTPMANWC